MTGTFTRTLRGVDRVRTTGGRLVFGDRLGLLLFLFALVFFGISWRVDVFITDSTTLVNGVGALLQGNLFVETPVLGSGLDSPGMYQAPNGPVARNYGELVPALLLLAALQVLGLLANLHVVVIALWHLLLLAFIVGLGARTGRRRLAAYGGAPVVLALFGYNLLLAQQLPAFAPYVLSLQLLTLGAAGLSAVVCYRLFASLHGRRIGLLAGGLLAVATPVGFWASLPKRHVFTGLAILVILFSIHRSHSLAPDARWWILPRSTAFRALAYATVGLYAWIHAGEALFMLGALAVVDLPTAPRLDARSLGTIGLVFGLSIVPMVTTNVVLAGDPLSPPRLLPDYVPGTDGGTGSGDDVFGGAAGGGTGILGVVARVRDLSLGGLGTLATDPDRVFRTYVRSRPLADMTLGGGGGQLQYAAANLSVLEAMPLATGLFAGLFVTFQRFRRGTRTVLASVTTTDLLAATIALTFAVLYAQSLPLVAQYTQRYLFPLFVLALYGLVRLPATRRVLGEHWRLTAWTYLLAVLVGGQLVFAFVVVSDLTAGEAFQLHAVANLLLGAALALLLAVASSRREMERPAAVGFGLAAAAGTVFVLLSGLVYFPIGPYALPIVEAFSELIAAA